MTSTIFLHALVNSLCQRQPLLTLRRFLACTKHRKPTKTHAQRFGTAIASPLSQTNTLNNQFEHFSLFSPEEIA